MSLGAWPASPRPLSKVSRPHCLITSVSQDLGVNSRLMGSCCHGTNDGVMCEQGGAWCGIANGGQEEAAKVRARRQGLNFNSWSPGREPTKRRGQGGKDSSRVRAAGRQRSAGQGAGRLWRLKKRPRTVKRNSHESTKHPPAPPKCGRCPSRPCADG